MDKTQARIGAFIFNLSKGGAQGVFVTVVNYLKQQGFEIEAITQNLDDSVYKDDLDEDTMLMDALDAGANDMQSEEEAFEIYTDPDAFNDVHDALEQKGYTFLSAQVEMVPQTYVKLESEEDVKSMEKLIDMLEDNDDVQNVYHNWDQD